MVIPFRADVSDIADIKPVSLRVARAQSEFKFAGIHDHSLDRSGFMEMH